MTEDSTTTLCADHDNELTAATTGVTADAPPALETWIHAAVALFPLALGLMAAVYAFGFLGRPGERFAGAVVLTGVALVYMVRREENRPKAEKNSFFVKALFCVLLATSVRSLAQAFLNQQLVSDFAQVHTNAVEFMRGEGPNLYAARYPYWGFLAVVLSGVYSVFGKGRLIYESFNLVCAAITTLALCYAGRGLTRSAAAGLAAGLVFALWPAMVAYSSLLTPEHPFVMLFPCACLTFMRAVTSHAARARLGWLAATGCLVGFMECFKPVASVLLAVFAITLLIHRAEAPALVGLPRPIGRILALPRSGPILWTGALLVTLGACFGAVKEVGYSLVEYKAGYPINRYGLGETLRVGLDPEGMGKYSTAVQERVREIEGHYGADFEGAHRALMADTLRIVKKSWRRLPAVLVGKFAYVWSSEERTLAWATRSPRDNSRTAYMSEPLRRFALPLCDAYWILVLVLACSGAVLCAIRRPGLGMMDVGLFVAGVASVLLFTEVQQRYRSVIAPALALLAGYGAVGLSRCLSWSREDARRMLDPLKSRFARDPGKPPK
ncbi:MAG: glycosyltransferase family 39 protein [Polyangiaceae bacterium]|nr:glycosyltransferase family 39 protein [Polyangiaceae bacterium]